MRHQQGDDLDQRFAAWVRSVSPRLLTLAVLLTGDWHQSEDLVQMTLVRMYATRSWLSADHPERYVRQTLINQYRSWMRKRSSRERPVERFPEATGGSADHGDLELRVTLFRALDQLSRLDRAVIILRYWDDCSVSETAGVVHCSEGAVRNRTSRALVRLRTVLVSDPSAEPERPPGRPLAGQSRGGSHEPS